jgi:putative CRISPR-associated protein (TIGR02619 family)
MKTIITTTGISLYSNTQRPLGKGIEPTDDQMRQYLRQDPENASAEANSLLKMALPEDHLVLLTTDTPLAQQCVNVLKSFFVNTGFRNVDIINLQFQDREEHIEKQGIRDLLSVLAAEIVKAQKKNQEIVINATTGFKAQVVYSTMIGMLYGVPVKYIHEKFKRVVTFNPIALNLDISLFINNYYFFEWIENEQHSHAYTEVEVQLSKRIYDDDERDRVRSFLEPVDEEGTVFLSPMAFTLFQQAGKYKEEAQEVSYPPSSGIENIDQKISASLLESKHHFTKDILAICRKIASLEYVKLIYGGFFEGTTRSRMGKFSEYGVIELSWADNKKAARLTITTTASGLAQTIKVRDKIKEILEIS